MQHEKRLKKYLKKHQDTYSNTTLKSVESKLRRAIKAGMDPDTLYSQAKQAGTSLYSVKNVMINAAKFEREILKTARFDTWLKENKHAFRHVYQTKSKFVSFKSYLQNLQSIKEQEGPGYYNLIVLLGLGGLRIAEARQVRWSDIENNVLTVTGKGRKVRQVPFNSQLLTLIHGSEYVTGEVRQQSDYQSRTRFSRWFPGYSFHDLRSMYINYMLNEKGLSIGEVMSLAGHSSITTTQRYLRTDVETLKQKAVFDLKEITG